MFTYRPDTKFFGSLRSVFVIGFCVFILSLESISMACVGKTLYIGTLDNIEDRILAVLLVMLINERTGTTVQERLFQDDRQLYKAMELTDEEQRVDIIVEDTEDAEAILNLASNNDPDQNYELIKKRYKKDLRIIWLNPFGLTNRKGKKGPTITASLLRHDVLINFPLLPRVLNKLAGVIDDEAFASMLVRADRGDKLRNIARDFLIAKKLI